MNIIIFSKYLVKVPKLKYYWDCNNTVVEYSNLLIQCIIKLPIKSKRIKENWLKN